MSLILNIVDMCRVCMRNDQNSDEQRYSLQDGDLWNQFYYTTQIKVREDDNLPKTICNICRARLLLSYRFILLAHESETSFKCFLENINDKFSKFTQCKATEEKEEEALQAAEAYALLGPEQFKTNEAATTNNCTMSVGATSEEIIEEGNEDDSTPSDKIPTIINRTGLRTGNSAGGIDSSLENIMVESGVIESQTEPGFESEGKVELLVISPENENNTPIEMTVSPNLAQDEEVIATAFVISNESSSCPQSPPNRTEEPLPDTDDHDPDYRYSTEDNELPESSTETDEFSRKVKQIFSPRVSQRIRISSRNRGITETQLQKRAAILAAARRRRSRKMQFICKHCGRDFSARNNLNRHVATHIGKRPFECKICEKQFIQKCGLKQHMLTHTGEKPFVCQVCKRAFSQHQSLVSHLRLHTGEKPFPCDGCDERFRHRESLKTHLKNVHIEKLTNDDAVESFKCTVCNSTYSTLNEARTHLNLHINKLYTGNNTTNGMPVAEGENGLETMQTLPISPDISSIMKELEEQSSNTSDEILKASGILEACQANASTSTAKTRRAKILKCPDCYKSYAFKKSLLRHLQVHKKSNPE